MALASQNHPAFATRAQYGSSGKLPDRSAMNNNPPPFGASSLSRRPEQRGGQSVQGQQQNPQGQGRGLEQEANPLDEIQEDQKEEINEAFSLFDLDRDKHLDYHELRVALRALGFNLPKPELVQILNQHGVPRGQSSKNLTSRPQDQPPHPSQLLIPQQAFVQLAAQRMLERDPREEIERAFDLFDSNGKGFIDLEDLRRVARELGETGLEEEELRAMIDEFDLEGIGGVAKEAFVGICLQ